MYLNIEKIINKYIKYVYIMSTVLLFVLYLWYKQWHMSNFAEFFQQYFKTLLGTETSHINYVKSAWLVQQEHTTINQEIKHPPPDTLPALSILQVAVTQILQLWYMELGAFNSSHGEVAAECSSLHSASPQTVFPPLRQCQCKVTLRKRFQNDFPTGVIWCL